jgi:hypothetical protein
MKTRRKADRLRARGIVVLADSHKGLVTNLCDIAPGGVSFLHTCAIDRSGPELRIDILIYENQSDFECFIPAITGRVRSGTMVTDRKSNKQMWRYGIEFLQMDSTANDLLLTFCSGQQPH